MDYIAAIKKKSSEEFQESGTIVRATVFMPLVAVIAIPFFNISLNNLELAAFMSFFGCFVLWMLWIFVARSSYEQTREIQRLQQVQKSKRSPIEVFEDGVKTAGQIALGLGVLAATVAVASSQNKKVASRRVVSSGSKMISVGKPVVTPVATHAVNQLQQLQERQKEAERRQQLAAEQRAQQERHRQDLAWKEEGRNQIIREEAKQRLRDLDIAMELQRREQEGI